MKIANLISAQGQPVQEAGWGSRLRQQNPGGAAMSRLPRHHQRSGGSSFLRDHRRAAQNWAEAVYDGHNHTTLISETPAGTRGGGCCARQPPRVSPQAAPVSACSTAKFEMGSANPTGMFHSSIEYMAYHIALSSCSIVLFFADLLSYFLLCFPIPLHPGSSGTWFSFSKCFGDCVKNSPIPFCHGGVGLTHTGLPPAYLLSAAKCG